MKIHVIHYKSSGNTSCRGCEMDRWDSDHETHSFDTLEEVAASIAAKRFDNEHADYGAWESTILYDWPGGDDDWEAQDQFGTRLEVETSKEHKRLFDEAVVLKMRRHVEEERRKEVIEAKAREDKEKRDRVTYERLKAKFEKGEL